MVPYGVLWSAWYRSDLDNCEDRASHHQHDHDGQDRDREAVHDRQTLRISAAQHCSERHEGTDPEGQPSDMKEDTRPGEPLRLCRARVPARGEGHADSDQGGSRECLRLPALLDDEGEQPGQEGKEHNDSRDPKGRLDTLEPNGPIAEGLEWKRKSIEPL